MLRLTAVLQGIEFGWLPVTQDMQYSVCALICFLYMHGRMSKPANMEDELFFIKSSLNRTLKD